MAEVYLAARGAAVPSMPSVVHTPDQVREHIGSYPLDRPDRRLWVAEVDGRPIGYAALTGCWLDQVYVHPDHARTGIGSALVDLVKAHASGGFSLWVFATNVPARAFYRAHGLVELEATDGADNEEHSPDIRMCWLGTDPLAGARRLIDEVDDQLAVLLARRFALTAAVQDVEAGAGRAGRSAAREQEIVDRLAARAPGLAEARLRRILEVVVTESLQAWEARRRGVPGG